MTAAEGEALTLQERISAIAQYVDRADALAAMILAVLDDTQDDIEAGTHAFLLIDQLATSVVDRSGPVCCDADDLFL